MVETLGHSTLWTNHSKGGKGRGWHLNFNSEQNGLNIELDCLNLVDKSSPIGNIVKWKKIWFFYFEVLEVVSGNYKDPLEVNEVP